MSLHQNKRVLVDVHPWVKDIHEKGEIRYEGIYRHAETLARKFTPALYAEDKMVEATKKLADHLRKGIVHIRDGGELESTCDIWLSIAPDSFCPLLKNESEVSYLTVAHDDFALKGYYGEANKEAWENGVLKSDHFLCVSAIAKEAIKAFVSTRRAGTQDIQYINYGASHRFDTMPVKRLDMTEHRSIGVGSLYPHKNLLGEVQIARGLDTDHYHVGAVKGNYEALHQAVEKGMRYLECLPDHLLDLAVGRAEHFICASREEGFSMPAMEAVLLGVPHIHLSDIPIHREVYDVGDESINWYDISSAKAVPMQDDLLVVSDRYREAMFQIHGVKNVSKEMEMCLNGLSK